MRDVDPWLRLLHLPRDLLSRWSWLGRWLFRVMEKKSVYDQQRTDSGPGLQSSPTLYTCLTSEAALSGYGNSALFPVRVSRPMRFSGLFSFFGGRVDQYTHTSLPPQRRRDIRRVSLSTIAPSLFTVIPAVR